MKCARYIQFYVAVPAIALLLLLMWNFKGNIFDIDNYLPFKRNSTDSITRRPHQDVNWTSRENGEMTNGLETAVDEGNKIRKTTPISDHLSGHELVVDISALTNAVKEQGKCLEVAADPKSFWRSQPYNHTNFTDKLDIDRMLTSIRCGLLYPEFMTTLPTTVLFPFEQYYLSEPPLHDVSQLTSEIFTIVTVQNSSTRFQIGDKITIRIDAKDRLGRRKVKGGDDFRVWFKDDNLTASMAAEVTDFDNGTYLATGKLLFAGQLSVYVALAYNREYLRAFLYLHQVIKTFRPIAAYFNNSKANESTPCYHTPIVPGFNTSELCNLTEVNGSPWYCGRPVKSQLSCNDLVGSSEIEPIFKILPVTKGEWEIFQRSCRAPRVRLIPNKLSITVHPDITNRSFIEPNTPCHKIPAKDTWTFQAPRGYFLKDTWYPSNCYNMDRESRPIRDCFKNRSIYFLGDSNMRNQYYVLATMSKCEEIKKALTRAWHKQLLCINSENNFTMSWDPHAYPFMIGMSMSELGSLIPSTRVIDNIPSHGRHLIIFNHFFHLTPSHFSAVEVKFRAIKASLLRLFQRNPDVQVLLQGPHIAWKGWAKHYIGGDTLGPHIMALQHEIFKDIQDRVVYFAPWDMSIADGNGNFHPHHKISYTNNILGFMCARQ